MKGVFLFNFKTKIFERQNKNKFTFKKASLTGQVNEEYFLELSIS